jgi:tetratricopeptide (TPR) repeat protein
MVSPYKVFVLSFALAAGGAVLAQTVDLGEPGSGQVEEASVHGTKAATVEQPPAATAEPARQLSPMRRGDILMARKMYREAIETYQDAVREAAIAYNKTGIAYHHLADFKAALRNYNSALELDPTYAEAINNIGTVYYAQKNPKKAIQQYEKALKFSPNSASIYSNLGTAHFSRKKYNEAFEAYQKAVDLNPRVFEASGTAGSLLQESSVEERAKYHFYLAKTYARAGDVERTLLYMRKSLEEGFRDKDRYRKDQEFASFQENETFQTLLAAEYRVL